MTLSPTIIIYCMLQSNKTLFRNKHIIKLHKISLHTSLISSLHILNKDEQTVQVFRMSIIKRKKFYYENKWKNFHQKLSSLILLFRTKDVSKLIKFSTTKKVIWIVKSLFIASCNSMFTSITTHVFICNTIACHHSFQLMDCLERKVTIPFSISGQAWYTCKWGKILA